MKVPVYAGDTQIGEVDVYASTWFSLPADVQHDLDMAVLDGKIVFQIQRGAVGEIRARRNA